MVISCLVKIKARVPQGMPGFLLSDLRNDVYTLVLYTIVTAAEQPEQNLCDDLLTVPQVGHFNFVLTIKGAVTGTCPTSPNSRKMMECS
jgi:hypothetical protein